MKTENKFYCIGCGYEIEFGDEDAVKYEGDLYCSEECVMDSLCIDEDPWRDEYAFKYTGDAENGYLIKLMDDDFFSNGSYVIWGKCKLSFDFLDRDYLDFVGFNVDLKYFKVRLDAIKPQFDEEDDFCPLKFDDGPYIEAGHRGILGFEFQRYLLDFILDYMGANRYTGDGVKVKLIDNDNLAIRYNGQKALLANRGRVKK